MARTMLFCLLALLGWACQDDRAATVDAAPTADAAVDAAVDAAPGPNDCRHAGSPGATAPCLEANRPPEYYVDEAEKYFDTLDVDADRDRVPDYAELVARWEWPPWLLLTGYGAEDMVSTADSLREVDPSTVPERDCRFFDRQPFARCYIVFEYDEGPCPIYEEFTFDAEGRMTFIEAWSDLPGLRPDGLETDPWGEAPDFPRLANRVPGLGSETGRIDLESEWMRAAAADDAEVADFAERATDWWRYWLLALREAPRDFFAQGCGW